MIQLVPADNDDPPFLSLAQRIMNGAITELQVREVFLIQVDNWFDHKWLRWRSRWKNRGVELCVPLFTPNRVRSEKHFIWDGQTSAWKSVGLANPLHVRQAGRPWLAQPIDRFSKCAAFIWYSGNTATNKVGSLMFYLSGAEGYSWYASLRKGEHWTVADGFEISRREILSFAERGVHLDLAEE